MKENKADIIELVDKINQWGLDRNITDAGGSTPLAQMSKLVEELAEFLVTYEKLSTLRAKLECRMEQNASISAGGQEVLKLLSLEDRLDDDYGDMLVCLIQAMRLSGTDMQRCLAKAWGDIKDRKGTVVAGKFVKETTPGT